MTAFALMNTDAANVNLIQFKERGRGTINGMMKELEAAGSNVSYLDASVITVDDLYLPMWDEDTKSVRYFVSDHILKGDVLILDETEDASDEVLEAIGTLMDNRTLGGVEVPALKAVVVFLNSGDERAKSIAEALRILGQTFVSEA